MLTQLGLNKMLFMVELIVAELIFFSGRARKSSFPLRLAFSYGALLLLTALFPILEYNAVYASVMFFALFSITIPFMKLCYDEQWLTVAFCCFAAFTVKEIAYAFTQLVMAASSFFIGSLDYEASVSEMLLGTYGNSSVQITSIFSVLCDLTFYSVVYLISYLVFAGRLKQEGAVRLRKKSFFLYALLIEVAVILLNAVCVYHSQVVFDQIFYLVFMVFMLFGCVTALYLQFSMLKNEQLQSELLAFSLLLGEREKQYMAAKESVDVINQKCHDLKHMIKSWRKDKGIIDEELAGIEQAISIYDAAVKTGNEALDVILTEKSLICKKYGITLTCLADAERLRFMREGDLYSLFGNLLDNAIEAVKKLDAPEKRIIALNIKPAEEMLTIGLSNYYQGTVELEGGLPRTSKKDKNYHGFGMKSVKRIVEQYGGALTLRVADNMFRVSILFPSSESWG